MDNTLISIFTEGMVYALLSLLYREGYWTNITEGSLS